MSLTESLSKYNKYKKLSTTDTKNIHIHQYKMDKYATILQNGGYDVDKLNNIDNAITQMNTILTDVHSGNSRQNGRQNGRQTNRTNTPITTPMKGGNMKQGDTLKNKTFKKNKTVVKINGINKLAEIESQIDKYNEADNDFNNELFMKL